MAKAIILLLILHIFPAVYGANITVGGNSGWTTGFDYVFWAKGQVLTTNDILLFNYGASHSVEEVSFDDYENCNTNNPIASYSRSPTSIPLSSTGTRYFICPTSNHCSWGMKLAVTITDGSSSGTPPPSTTNPPPPPSTTSAPPSPPPSTTGSPPLTASRPSTPAPPPRTTSSPPPTASTPAPSPRTTLSPPPPPRTTSSPPPTVSTPAPPPRTTSSPPPGKTPTPYPSIAPKSSPPRSTTPPPISSGTRSPSPSGSPLAPTNSPPPVPSHGTIILAGRNSMLIGILLVMATLFGLIG